MKRTNLLLIIACIISMIMPQTVLAESGQAAAEGGTIVYATDSYVYYGSYPQIEVVDDKLNCGTTDKSWATDNDCIVDANLYAKLQSASWDSSGDTEIDGVKYHKLIKSEATDTISDPFISSGYFNWGEEDERYFRYDPIKWKVLDKDGDDLFVVAEKALDHQMYYTSFVSVTWEESTVRTWLNGTFYNRAFNSAEQAFIKTTDVVNSDNKHYGTNGGNNTKDKVFLLSDDEVYGTKGEMYGFASLKYTFDKARMFKSTTYAKAMGALASSTSSDLGTCYWWLRSPGETTDDAECVSSDGYLTDGIPVNEPNSILPALHINLKSNYLISRSVSVSKDDVKLSATTMEYDGTECKPTVTIKGLIEGTDYTVSYSNNINIGTGIVTITGIGACSGTITKTFSIELESKIDGELDRPVYSGTVTYGSYPQTEIIYNEECAGTYGKSWGESSDYEVDVPLYSKLLKASWDSSGDTEIDGVKYHKLTKSEATCTGSDGAYFNWGEEDERYFRYDPIKWKVLDKDGDDLFVVAEKALDDQRYNTSSSSVTWEESTVRTWLNGTFYNRAFNSAEQAFIKTTDVVNSDNIQQGTNGGNNTKDKVFLLSEDEVYGTKGEMYGFARSSGTYDKTRQFKSTTYAKAMGAYAYTNSSYLGNCEWWLRSPGGSTRYAAYIKYYGYVNAYGDNVTYNWYGILPALHINLKSNNIISGADSISDSKKIPNTSISLARNEVPYNGKAVEPKVLIEGLIEGEDFTVSYSNNDKIGIGTAIATGKGRWSGTLSRIFAIVESVDISDMEATLSETTCIYYGEPCEPKVTIKGFTEGEEFKVEYSDNNEAGIATVTITGINGYTGTITKSFKIKQGETVDKKEITLSKTTYIHDGSERKPSVTVSGLTKDVDYTISYSDNIEVGTAKVIIKGIGNYGGSVTKEFAITHDIETHAAKAPTCTEGGYDAYETCKVEGCTYTTYKEIDKLGHKYVDKEAKAATTEESGYTAYRECSRCSDIQDKTIIPKIDASSIVLDTTSYEYDGNVKTPAVSVYDMDGNELSKGTDYTVSYENNVNAGTAKAKITFEGNYSGLVERTFGIVEKTLSGYKVELSESEYTYDGTEKKPIVTVFDADDNEFSSSNYTVTYSNNIKAGTATVTIKGIGNYQGTITKTFNIIGSGSSGSGSSGGGSTGGGGGGAIAPAEPEDSNITNSGSQAGGDASTSVDVKKNTTVTEGKTETKVDADLGSKIVENAVENKSTDVVIKAETEQGSSSASTVALPASTIKDISDKTEASVTIKTDSAEVSLDKAAVAAVVAKAGTEGEVKLVVETKEAKDDQVVVELKIETSNGTVSSFNGGNVTVTVPVSEELASKTLVCVYIDDNGVYTKVGGSLSSDKKTFVFTTDHFSTYAILEEAEADAIIAEQEKPAEEAKPVKIGTTNVKLYTYKGGKLRVKALAKNATGYKVYYKKSSWKKYKSYTKGNVKTLDKTFKKLAKGKYTVKVKAYNKAADGKLIMGAASKAKTIIVKK